MRRELLDALLASVRAERTVVLVTDLASGDQSLLHPFEDDDGDEGAAVRAAARDAALDDAARTVEVGGRSVFVRPYNPPLRMVVVGAVHIAQPLASLAATAGFRVRVVDPRRAFATPERFPGVELVRSWPDEAFEASPPDRRTAVVTLTHDPKLDDPALAAALRSDAFYVGALGSRRTHARRRERLAGEGFDEAELDRIRGPVGLDIGARSPGEIAVAIVAEAVAVLRGATP